MVPSRFLASCAGPLVRVAAPIVTPNGLLLHDADATHDCDPGGFCAYHVSVRSSLCCLDLFVCECDDCRVPHRKIPSASQHYELSGSPSRRLLAWFWDQAVCDVSHCGGCRFREPFSRVEQHFLRHLPPHLMPLYMERQSQEPVLRSCKDR